jgi:integrase
MQPIINVNLRKDKEKEGKCPIILQVYYKGKRKQVFTGLFVKESDFEDGKVKNITNKAHYNQLIINKKNELEREFLTQSVSGSVTLISKKVTKEHSFFPYAYAMLEQMKTRCKKSYLDRFGYLLEQFKSFAGDVIIADVTPELLKTYEKYLFTNKITPNTIGRNLKKIKQVLNDYGTPIKFKTITYKQPKREYLTVHEIEQIEQSNYDHIVKWYFLLSCYTGLRYGDMQGIKNKVVLNDGITRLILSTTKTGEIVSIKLIDKVIGILENIHEPIPTNEQSNRVLKELSVICGVEKNLTFHMARHSFAVNSANLGFPIEVVSKLLGHSSIRTTAIYFKITDTKVDEWMDKWS